MTTQEPTSGAAGAAPSSAAPADAPQAVDYYRMLCELEDAPDMPANAPVALLADRWLARTERMMAQAQRGQAAAWDRLRPQAAAWRYDDLTAAPLSAAGRRTAHMAGALAAWTSYAEAAAAWAAVYAHVKQAREQLRVVELLYGADGVAAVTGAAPADDATEAERQAAAEAIRQRLAQALYEAIVITVAMLGLWMGKYGAEDAADAAEDAAAQTGGAPGQGA